MEVNKFLEYIQNTKKVSKNTVSAYKQDIIAFEKFLRSEGVTEFTDAGNTQVVYYEIGRASCRERV